MEVRVMNQVEKKELMGKFAKKLQKEKERLALLVVGDRKLS